MELIDEPQFSEKTKRHAQIQSNQALLKERIVAECTRVNAMFVVDAMNAKADDHLFRMEDWAPINTLPLPRVEIPWEMARDDELLEQIGHSLGLTFADASSESRDYLERAAGMEFLIESAPFQPRDSVVAKMGLTDVFLCESGSAYMSVGGWVVMPRSFMDACHKVLLMRGCALAYASDDDELHQLMVDVYRCMDGLVDSLGSAGLEIVKSIETLAKGVALDLEGCVAGGFNAKDAAIEKIMTKALGGPGENWARRMIDTVTSCRTSRHAIEVMGLQKHAGSPVISLEATMKRVRALGTTRLNVAPERAEEIRAYGLAVTLEGYVRTKGEWPRFDVEPKDGTALRKLHLQRAPICRIGMYPMSDWEGVWIGQIYEFDLRPSGLDGVDDKAIAPPRATLVNGRWTGAPVEGTESRSLIEAVISIPEFDTKECVENWERRDLDTAEICILLATKGGEMKGGDKGREFAMLERRDREAASVAEACLMDNDMPLSKSASKPLTPSQLSSRMRWLSSRKGIFIELDLSNWNLHFGDANCAPLADACDRMAGRNFWKRLHRFFGTCHIASSESNRFEGSAAWDNYDNHVNGFEGQAQSFWQKATEAFVLATLDRIGYSGIVTLQGDNVTIQGPEPESVELLLREIGAMFQEYGHELKVEETEVYVGGGTYSKRFYIRGKEYAPVAKFVASMLNIPEGQPRTRYDTIMGASSALIDALRELEDPYVAYAKGEWLLRTVVAPYLDAVLA